MVLKISVLECNRMCSGGNTCSPCCRAHLRAGCLQTWGLMLLLSPQAQHFPHLWFAKALIQAGACSFVCLLLCFDLEGFLKYLNGKSIDLCFCHFSFHSDFFQLISPIPHHGSSHPPCPLPPPIISLSSSTEKVCTCWFG